ncbi:MAG: S9 family peptidase [Blastocatellia bacterium]
MKLTSSLRRILVYVSLVSLLLPGTGLPQQPAEAGRKFALTVDNIMRGPELVGYSPAGVYWSRDSQRVYFRWKQADAPRLREMDMYVVNRDGSGLRKLSEEEAKLAPPAGGDLSRDKKWTLYNDEGDIWLYDNVKNERRQITKTTDGENNPQFTLDQKHISFTRANNLYVMALDGAGLTQLTDIRTGGAGDAPAVAFAGGGGRFGGGGGFRQGGGAGGDGQQRGTDSQEFIKKEERELIEAVRERALNREEQEAKRKKRETRKPFNIPAGQAPAGLSLTPDGKYVIVTLIEPGAGAKNTIVPNYITESAYTEDIPGRNKVGDNQGRSRMAVIHVETGEVKNVDHGLKAETKAAAQTATPDAQQQNPPQGPPQGPPQRDGQTRAAERPVQLLGLTWSEDGKNAVLQARATDNKDRWIMRLDPVTAKTTILFHERDDAWIGGPGGFSLGWLPDNKTIYFQSERSGYAHLYTLNIDGGEPKQLTKGPYEVFGVRLSDDKTRFYYTSSEGRYSATEDWRAAGQTNPSGDDCGSFSLHLYSSGFDGAGKTRLTALKGQNAAIVSPDQSTLAIVRSYGNQPPELYLAPNRAGAAESDAKQITTSTTAEWRSHNWIDPPIVQFRARDGAMVPARMYKPANFAKGGPAVLFVHGAGYLQNVHKGWSSYFREYMFHHLLMERGYLVLDVDYRASAGYGRDWRTGIYRHMGGKDLSDQVDAVKYLISEHGVDAKRVGLYGGSYGGFITLMAMFTEPDVFAAGAALRPVTDWAHYNHGYTANILNTPQGDAEAYKRSSPIYFAQGLKGALLICHGMVDVNVHFQDSVRLAQRLIELRKENWELAAYPVEDHGFERASSWADEYKRILKLFETNLKAGMTAVPVPEKKKKK